jgi:hypothetical protein
MTKYNVVMGCYGKMLVKVAAYIFCHLMIRDFS